MKPITSGIVAKFILFSGILWSVPGISLAADPAANQVPAQVIDTGTTAWMLTSTALVLLMVPGLAMFYGGLVRTKNVALIILSAI